MNLSYSAEAFNTFLPPLLNLLIVVVVIPVFWKPQPKQMRFPTSAASLQNQTPAATLRSTQDQNLKFLPYLWQPGTSFRG